MDKISTPFLTFTDIAVNEIDILEDAFFSDLGYGIVSKLVSEVLIEPPPGAVSRIIDRV